MNPPVTHLQEVPHLLIPEPDAPLKDHADSITWAQWMDEMAERLQYHLRHHDSPEERLATKIHERFVL
jgi:hypothetical protein